jgi:hypothetical protein
VRLICVFLTVFLLAAHAGAGEISNLNSDQLLPAQQALFFLAHVERTWDKISGPGQRHYQLEIEKADLKLHDSGFYIIPDSGWAFSRGKDLFLEPAQIRNASVEEIRMLLGAISRLDLVNPGLLGYAIMTDVYLNASLVIGAPPAPANN